MLSSDSFVTQGDIAIKQSQTVRGRRIDSSSLTMHGEPNLTTSAHHKVRFLCRPSPSIPRHVSGPNFPWHAMLHSPGLYRTVTALAPT